VTLVDKLNDRVTGADDDYTTGRQRSIVLNGLHEGIAAATAPGCCSDILTSAAAAAAAAEILLL